WPSERGGALGILVPYWCPWFPGYVRVLLAAAAFVLMPREPGPAAACYLLSALLDAVDGLAARMLGQGGRGLGVWAGPASGGPAPSRSSTLEGADSHKGAGPGGSRLLQLYYGNRAVLFLLCAANEGFYCSLYLVYFWEGPAGQTGSTGREWEGGLLVRLGALGGNGRGDGGTGTDWGALGGTGRGLG
uniref:CDP-diacylglycerol--inositol 3-phosphatidyltransferase n=1 Tax=Anas zonorhyncha TaxID=75864 RepID=A0A8B9ZXN7_9AVES